MSTQSLRLAASLEGLINGKACRELEYTFYARIVNMRDLDNAIEKEEHEQWKLPLENDRSGHIRARLRLINNRRPTMATKVYRPGVLGAEEVESDISMDMFTHLRLAAEDGYKKTRYNYPIPGTNRKWEVDVFMGRDGNPHPWVKIDLEVETPNDPIPELPIEVTDLIVQNGPKYGVEERRFVRSLWETEWQKLDAPAGIPVTDDDDD